MKLMTCTCTLVAFILALEIYQGVLAFKCYKCRPCPIDRNDPADLIECSPISSTDTRLRTCTRFKECNATGHCASDSECAYVQPDHVFQKCEVGKFCDCFEEGCNGFELDKVIDTGGSPTKPPNWGMPTGSSSGSSSVVHSRIIISGYTLTLALIYLERKCNDY